MQMHSVERLDDYVILIPAYNPDQALVTLVRELKEEGFVHLFVVNDGSAETSRPIFDEVGKWGDGARA